MNPPTKYPPTFWSLTPFCREGLCYLAKRQSSRWQAGGEREENTIKYDK